MQKKRKSSDMPIFTSNYPGQNNTHEAGAELLPTPERVGALSEYTGEGVTIAFLDSGYYAHPDLKGRIKVHVDATNRHIKESQHVPKSEMFSWHGQMTTVICAGDGSRSGGKYRGIARKAQLVLIKISDERYRVKERDIIRGLEWLLYNHKRFNVKVANLSVGGDHVSYSATHPLHELVTSLTDEGVTVVAASGNSALDFVVPPASAADAITVGGIDDNNTTNHEEWTLYTHNYGMGHDGSTKPDVLAPARWLASPILPGTLVAREAFWLGALLKQDEDAYSQRLDLMTSGKADAAMTQLFGDAYNKSLYSTLQEHIHMHKVIHPDYQHVDGTSTAAPIVSGVIAQMLEANPALTPKDIKRIIKSTAFKLPDEPEERQGAGIINPAQAVKHALKG